MVALGLGEANIGVMEKMASSLVSPVESAAQLAKPALLLEQHRSPKQPYYHATLGSALRSTLQRSHGAVLWLPFRRVIMAASPA